MLFFFTLGMYPSTTTSVSGYGAPAVAPPTSHKAISAKQRVVSNSPSTSDGETTPNGSADEGGVSPVKRKTEKINDKK